MVRPTRLVLSCVCLVTAACGGPNQGSSTSTLEVSPQAQCLQGIQPQVATPTYFDVAVRYGQVTLRAATSSGQLSPVLEPFFVEAGSALVVRYAPLLAGREVARFVRDNPSMTIDFMYRVDGGPEQTLSLQLSGATSAWETEASARLVLPSTARSVLGFTFRLTAANGSSVVDHGDPSAFSIRLAPRASSLLCFADDWSVVSDTRLEAGSAVAIAYDVDRVYSRLAGTVYNGLEVWSVTANMAFYDGDDHLVTQSSQSLKTPGAPPMIVIFPVPLTARRISVWFDAGAAGGMVYDSNYGRNFAFAVTQDPERQGLWSSTISNISMPSLANGALPAPRVR